MRQLDGPCRQATYSSVQLWCPCLGCDHILAQTQHLPLAPALAHLHSSWCHLSAAFPTNPGSTGSKHANTFQSQKGKMTKALPEYSYVGKHMGFEFFIVMYKHICT
ncbi:hypothetical protein XELAEV_18019687mg [Xenopus laevis]|uniref:Uncharacterized protein n=1 Tax=Xenopus laevis TaxID=8355 RepID=A0A974D6D3_XENLA|nr:hypothetical protein XELAEV_18019687mg [Xenopus laevis]